MHPDAENGLFGADVKIQASLTEQPCAADRDEITAAYKAWHRGESLTDRQRDLIDQARIECLSRVYASGLWPSLSAGKERAEVAVEGT